ncbi:uncharacterized protein LOC116337716 [Contarinia nasturtii]|uniref:uncharacterized protein LOC116337716 n=1 Tax=Contarinia nasturtii TaxID=265458 RepID=UPI0012D47CD2|nr:uncharacterized protein LOC116337716 [Contarinia nasturtii]
MLIKCVIFILTALLCSHTLCDQSVESKRNGKFFGITGYFSGSSDFHVVPFWKQWNALFQVNVEKNKHKHNNEIYVLPASQFYYPPYDSYGLYVPHMYGGLGGGGLVGNRLHGPMSLLLDEYNFPATTLAPLNPDINDRPKLEGDSNDDGAKKNVGLFNLNIRDDRKTHKRDIVHKTITDNEVVATVVEITDINIDKTTTATSAATSEPDIYTTTESNESQTTETIESTTSSIPSSSTSENPTASIVDTGFQPILNFYYGGTPNANYIYITTAEPIQEPTPSTELPNTINDRYDWGEFKPSIQYEYRNYRFKPDKHFVPVAGTKQVY